MVCGLHKCLTIGSSEIVSHLHHVLVQASCLQPGQLLPVQHIRAVVLDMLVGRLDQSVVVTQ